MQSISQLVSVIDLLHIKCYSMERFIFANDGPVICTGVRHHGICVLCFGINVANRRGRA